MITIPKNTRKKKSFLKVCKEPGCGREFIGFGVSKYCEDHRDPKARAKKARAVSNHSHNAYIKHNYTNDVVVEIRCRHCGVPFNIRLVPKQFIYPAMCERHRTVDATTESTMG